MSIEHKIEKLELEETEMVCGGVIAGPDGKSCTEHGMPKGPKTSTDKTMTSLGGSNF